MRTSQRKKKSSRTAFRTASMGVRNLQGPMLFSYGQQQQQTQAESRETKGEREDRKRLAKKELPGSFGIANRLYSIIDRYLTDLKCP